MAEAVMSRRVSRVNAVMVRYSQGTRSSRQLATVSSLPVGERGSFEKGGGGGGARVKGREGRREEERKRE